MFKKKKIKITLIKNTSFQKNKNTNFLEKLKFIKLSNNKIANYFSYFWIIIIFIMLFLLFNKLNAQNIKITNENKNTSNISYKEKEKKKEENKKIEEENKNNDEKINFLIVGRWWYWNDAPELTDSLMVLSYHKKKKHISILSIPRDLYVNYNLKDKNNNFIKWKINALYVMNLEQTQNREKSMQKLQNKIEEIINEKIDYYINIDFKGFIKLIDQVWWVKVNVPKTLIDEKFPDNNHWYQTFILRKWNWILDWKTALKYVRSRKNTWWDFSRNKRQQQVIKSLKEKIFSKTYLTNPSKIKKIYTIFDTYIQTDIWLINFIKIATSIKSQDNLQFYSSTLNTSCIKKEECVKWWFLFYPQRKYFWWQSVLLSWDSNYLNIEDFKKIHIYSDIIFNNPDILNKKEKIAIFSKNSHKKEALLLKEELIKYWLNINPLEIIGHIPDKYLGSKWWFWWKTKIISKVNDISLLDYNKLKKENKLHTLKKDIEQEKFSEISIEANNWKTKLIINWIDKKSNTILFLKKYLNIEEKNIIFNKFWPKYAKDTNTRIEILFIK